MTTDNGFKDAPVQITEDEAAVYDRQIRLWGLEAQQRMRNAVIMVVNLKGVATETVKNIVLAGIGKLIIIDGDDVAEEDLGAGFFFRDEDVGKKRVEVAKARVESLNPSVTVEIIPSWLAIGPEAIESTVRVADVVCVTDWKRDDLIRLNDTCRRLGKLFYAGGTYGLLGYIFCDLLKHTYLGPDRKNPEKRVDTTISYCSLKQALQPYKWTGMSRVQTKNINPAVVFTILGIWEFQSRHQGELPTDMGHASELESIAGTMFSVADVNKAVKSIPQNLIQTMAITAAHELSPVCAIVGGMLAQDILKALAAREPTIANFFVFDGNTGHGSADNENKCTDEFCKAHPASTNVVLRRVSEAPRIGRNKKGIVSWGHQSDSGFRGE